MLHSTLPSGSSVKMNQPCVNWFIKYCQCNGYVSVPVLEIFLCGFVSSLADVGLKHGTIETYLSGCATIR